MRDTKGIREVRKELFAHYLKGKDSYRTLSRLDRYEYVYETMRLVRNYTCLKNGINPDKVDLMFENYGNPKTRGRASLYKEDSSRSLENFHDDVRGLVTISTGFPLKTFRELNSIYHIAFHEMKHIADFFAEKNSYVVAESSKSIKPFMKNPMVKKISKFEMNQIANIRASYNKFGVAWFGDKKEIRADKAALKELNRLEIKNLLKSEKKVEPLKKFVENSFSKIKIMTNHRGGSIAFGLFKIFSGFKTPEKVENDTQTNMKQDNHTRSLVSISSIRRAADNNPDLFRQEDYISHVVGRKIRTIEDLKETDDKYKEVLARENYETVKIITDEERLGMQNDESDLQEDESVSEDSSITVEDCIRGILDTRQQMKQAQNDQGTEEGMEIGGTAPEMQ